MYFADPTDTPRTLRIHTNGRPLESEYDVSANGSGGGTLDTDLLSLDTGLLQLSFIPVDGSGPALISGIQIYATKECPKPVAQVFETTGASL